MTDDGNYSVSNSGKKGLSDMDIPKADPDRSSTEQLCSELINNLGEGIAVIDENDRFRFANPALEEFLGVGRGYLEGKDFNDFLTERSRLIMEGQKIRGAKGIRDTFRLEIITKDSRSSNFLITATPRKSKSGEYSGSILAIRNIGEIEENERDLRREREKFRTILNSIQEGIVQVRVGTGEIEDLNPMAGKMIGLPENVLKGRDIGEFISTEGEDPVFTRSKNITTKNEGILTKANGDTVEVITSAIRTDLGGRESVILSFMDISDQSKRKVTLEKMNDLLRLINKILRHDMLNNLMIVTMGIEHYFDYGEDKLLKNSMLATNRSLELIRSMKELEFFLTDGGALREYNVEKIATAIANNNPIDILVAGHASIMADEALSSLLDNLVSNSIKHGKADKVWITIKEDNQEVLIDVADNGIGIPDENKDKIFKEGFTTSKKRGTGIGLFIVEKTIDRYGGSIEVLDNQPKGSQFRIRLPRIKAK